MSWLRFAGMNCTQSRRAKGALLLGLFLSLLGLATSAKVHQLLHPAANQSDHHCAATMLASGKVDAAPSIVMAPPVALGPWVETKFEFAAPSVPSFNLPLSRGPPAHFS